MHVYQANIIRPFINLTYLIIPQWQFNKTKILHRCKIHAQMSVGLEPNKWWVACHHSMSDFLLIWFAQNHTQKWMSRFTCPSTLAFYEYTCKQLIFNSSLWCCALCGLSLPHAQCTAVNALWGPCVFDWWTHMHCLCISASYTETACVCNKLQSQP